MGRTARVLCSAGAVGGAWLTYLTTQPVAAAPTPPVPAGGHVAVIGAGPVGLAQAYRLAKAGMQVTVFEAADRAGGGARGNDGLLGGARGKCLDVWDMTRGWHLRVDSSVLATREWWAAAPRWVVASLSRTFLWGNATQKTMLEAEAARTALFDESRAAWDAMAAPDAVPALAGFADTTGRPAELRDTLKRAVTNPPTAAAAHHFCEVWRHVKHRAGATALEAAAAATNSRPDQSYNAFMSARDAATHLPHPEYTLPFAGQSEFDTGAVAVYCDDAGRAELLSTDPDAACRALYDACLATGNVAFRFSTPVTLEVDPEDAAGGRCVVAVGKGVHIHPDAVVLCAGKNSASLARPLCTLPFLSVARYVASEPVTSMSVLPAEGRCIIDDATGVAMMRRGDKMWWYASGEVTGTGRSSDAAQKALRKHIRKAVPTNDRLCVDTASQTFAFTPDYCPAVGHCAGNLWVNGGFGASSYQLAFPAAARLAEQMRSGEPDAVLAALSPHRFFYRRAAPPPAAQSKEKEAASE